MGLSRRDFLSRSLLAGAALALRPSLLSAAPLPWSARAGQRPGLHRREDEWSRGAYSWFRPGQMTTLLPHIARTEGRLLFAGEHASDHPGWMQGALASGVRAAREINEAG